MRLSDAAEMRLINLDKLIENKFKNDISYNAFVNLVKRQETVDAVPVVRCRECKYISMTTIGMDYACWHGAESVYGQTGEHAGHVVCQRIESLDHFCAYGERRDPDA